MDLGIIITLIQKMLVLTLEMAAPILLVGVVVGLMVSVFQTVTQIQEATLTFVPKIIAGIVALIILLPWMVNVFIMTVNEFYDMIPDLIRGA